MERSDYIDQGRADGCVPARRWVSSETPTQRGTKSAFQMGHSGQTNVLSLALVLGPEVLQRQQESRRDQQVPGSELSRPTRLAAELVLAAAAAATAFALAGSHT